jgi:hypothetical protein
VADELLLARARIGGLQLLDGRTGRPPLHDWSRRCARPYSHQLIRANWPDSRPETASACCPRAAKANSEGLAVNRRRRGRRPSNPSLAIFSECGRPTEEGRDLGSSARWTFLGLPFPPSCSRSRLRRLGRFSPGVRLGRWLVPPNLLQSRPCLRPSGSGRLCPLPRRGGWLQRGHYAKPALRRGLGPCARALCLARHSWPRAIARVIRLAERRGRHIAAVRVRHLRRAPLVRPGPREEVA